MDPKRSWKTRAGGLLSRQRWAAVVALVVLLAAAGLAAWRSGRRDGGDSYVTATVDRGPIAATVTATGTLNPVTTVQVGTYVSGPIQAIDVDFNSPVKKGQRVAKIDPAPFLVKVQQADANLANARARVAKARADLALKKVTLERTRQIREQGLVSAAELDGAQSNYDQAVAQLALDEASVQQAKALLQDARINLGYTDIVSPVDGVVVSRNVNVGQTVAASFQTPTLFLIAEDLTAMQVDTNVSESDIGVVREGQAASFTVDSYPGRQFTGRVSQVRNAPITVQNVVTYDVVLAVENASLELKPGMTATVKIITANREGALRIPVRALRFRPEPTTEGKPEPVRTAKAGAAVWAPDGTEGLRRIEVRTGVRNDDFVEILDGDLREGDVVVVARKRSSRASTPAPPRFTGWRPAR